MKSATKRNFKSLVIKVLLGLHIQVRLHLNEKYPGNNSVEYGNHNLHRTFLIVSERNRKISLHMIQKSKFLQNIFFSRTTYKGDLTAVCLQCSTSIGN